MKAAFALLLACFAIKADAFTIAKRDAPHALAALSARPSNTYLPARLQNGGESASVSSSNGHLTNNVEDNESEAEAGNGASSSQLQLSPEADESSNLEDTESISHHDEGASSSGNSHAPQITNDYLPPHTSYGTPVVSNGNGHTHTSHTSSTSVSASSSNGNGHSSQNGNGHHHVASSGVNQKYDSNGGYVY